MKGCVAVLGIFLVALVGGLVMTGIVWQVTGSEKIAVAVGTGFWLLSFITMVGYASLSSASAHQYSLEPTSWQESRFSAKIRRAPISYAVIFAILGGIMTQHAGAHWSGTAAAASVLAVIGGLIGYDIKWRHERIRNNG